MYIMYNIILFLFFFFLPILSCLCLTIMIITTENSENLKHELGVICFLSYWYNGGSCFYWWTCHMFFVEHVAEVKYKSFFSTILNAFFVVMPQSHNFMWTHAFMSTLTEPAEWCSHHPELLFSLRSLPGWTDHIRHTWKLMLNTGAKWPFHQSLM